MRVDSNQAVSATRAWITEFVVGLGICPFASSVLGDLELLVYEGSSLAELSGRLEMELTRFASADAGAHPTSILIAPNVLRDFADYNEFLGVVDGVLAGVGLEGVVQIASFHPSYLFAEGQPGDVGHYTNRSPYPMFHMLREEHVSQAVAAHPDTLKIPEENIARLRELGLTHIRLMLEKCLTLSHRV